MPDVAEAPVLESMLCRALWRRLTVSQRLHWAMISGAQAIFPTARWEDLSEHERASLYVGRRELVQLAEAVQWGAMPDAGLL